MAYDKICANKEDCKGFAPKAWNKGKPAPSKVEGVGAYCTKCGGKPVSKKRKINIEKEAPILRGDNVPDTKEIAEEKEYATATSADSPQSSSRNIERDASKSFEYEDKVLEKKHACNALGLPNKPDSPPEQWGRPPGY